MISEMANIPIIGNGGWAVHATQWKYVSFGPFLPMPAFDGDVTMIGPADRMPPSTSQLKVVHPPTRAGLSYTKNGSDYRI